MRSAFVLACAFVSLTVAANAHCLEDAPTPLRGPETEYAPDPEPSAWDRRTTLTGHFGVGTPLGFGGVAIEQSLLRWFAVEGGAGMNGRGPQLSLMARTRWVFTLINEASVDLGAGVSGGPYRWREITFGDGQPAVRDWDVAIWGNGEVGTGYRSRGGFVLRFYFGYAIVLNAGAGECSDADGGDIDHCRTDHKGKGGEQLPYFGLALGYAFR